MLPVDRVPDVGASETLSRFIFSKRHIRRESGTLKADAFVPHPHSELSVNRDLEAMDEETWQVAQAIAVQLSKSLYGRGDTLAATYHGQKLKTIASPISGNTNHVNVTGWKLNDKASQKVIAQEIVAVAKFISCPDLEHLNPE